MVATKAEPRITHTANNDPAAAAASPEEAYESMPQAQLGFGIMARYPVISVVLCAVLGVLVGYGLSTWQPADEALKINLVRWVGLIGDLFLRALKCIVLPLVFINVVLSTVDMLQLGKAGKVVKYTIGLYLTTTVLAAIIGILSVLMFKGFFIPTNVPTSPPKATFKIECEAGSFMTKLANGEVGCVNAEVSIDDPSTSFRIIDVNGQFQHASSGPANDVSLSDTIYDGVFVKLISENIVGDFVTANFASIIFFAVVFGVAIHRATSRVAAATDKGTSYVIQLFRELDRALCQMINWILALTPFAVCSLVANAIGKQDDLVAAFSNVGILLCATLVGFTLHFFVVYMGMFVAITGKSPITYLRKLVPAQCLAFASASSAATIPVNIQCAVDSGEVTPFIAKFVVPLGATVNMDGGAIYFALATIFLAVTSGLEDQITVASYIMLVIIATIGSAGTAPVPSASLVLIITAYNTIFNTTGTPAAFSFILAIDWLLDRGRTTLNVTGDAIVARLVSHLMARDARIAEQADAAGAANTGLESTSALNAV